MERHERLRENDAQQSELAALIDQLTPHDGMHPTAIDALNLFRSSTRLESIHGVYKPSLCLIARGSKQVMLGENVYLYDPSHFLLVAVDLPVISQVAEATPEEPYLSLSLDIDPRQISTLVAELSLSAAPAPPTLERGIAVGYMDALLSDTVVRLLRLLDTPQHMPVLAPLIEREILYLLLASEQGAALRRMAFAGGEMEGVIKVLHRLKDCFAEPLRVEDLAREAHMSVSVFHQHFKAVTALTPLQYQKRLRLQEARRLMLGEAVPAATAGFQVGYESPSQFSREYRRLFGDSPQRDVARLRESA
jgi:AraC-like DNA-binding protein